MCNQGIQSLNLNCSYRFTQYLTVSFPICITDFCLNFIHCLFRESATQMDTDQLTQNPVTQPSCKRHLEKDEIYRSYSSCV